MGIRGHPPGINYSPSPARERDRGRVESVSARSLMALDMGTSSIKCLIVDTDGVTRAITRREISYDTLEELTPLAREFSPSRIWATACLLIREALDRAGLVAEDIAAISTTSQRQGIVALDRDGSELYAGPNRDVRAFFEGMALDEDHSDEIYAATGHLPSFLFAPAKINWLKAHRPDVVDMVDKVLPISGWLTFKLSGETVCERSAMGEIGLVNVSTGEPEPSWIEDGSLIPGLATAGEVVGEVTSLAASETGLPKGLPVVLGGPDTQCGLLGMAVTSPGQLGILTGWSTPLQMVTSEPVFDPQKRTWTGCHLLPGRRVLESNTTEAGGSLDWINRILNTANEADDKQTEDLALGVDQTVAFLGPRIMNCSNMGLRLGGVLFPVPVAQSGLNGSHLYKAALENLAFAIRGNHHQIEEIAGSEISEVRLSGGVTNVPAFPQLIADTLDREVEVPVTRDSSPMGAAICAGVGIGAYRSLEEAAVAMRGDFSTLVPASDNADALDQRYQRWLSIYEELEKLSEAL